MGMPFSRLRRGLHAVVDKLTGRIVRDPPRLIVFFIVLPDPIPFPHATTYSFVLDREVPSLSGTSMAVTESGPEMPASEGRLFVSLRFWQARAGMADFESAFKSVGDVMRASLPKDLY